MARIHFRETLQKCSADARLSLDLPAVAEQHRAFSVPLLVRGVDTATLTIGYTIKRSSESRVASPHITYQCNFCRQHFLYFFPLPQGQGSLRPILVCSRR